MLYVYVYWNLCMSDWFQVSETGSVDLAGILTLEDLELVLPLKGTFISLLKKNYVH